MSNRYENEVMDDINENEQVEPTEETLHLTFVIDNENFAINVSEVTDILQYTTVTVVPKTPNYLKGIINLRGDIIPVICVRSKFMKPEIQYDEQTCIIKVQYGEYALGLIVDRVNGCEKIFPENIMSPPSAKLNYHNQFIKGIGRTETGVKMILSLDKLIF